MTDALRMPIVSAIVSTYNSAAFIRGCIEDLERQTMADQLEIIVIDSASPQDEGAVIKELQCRYGNIRYLRTAQRETVYAAWNRAIDMARGRYITNANSDDRHRNDAFELMVRVLENDPSVDLVYADVIITRTPHETYEQHTTAGRYSWFDWDRNTLLDNGCFIGPQPMWRRSLHDLYGGFDANYVTSGDYEFWLRISQTSSFKHINQPLGLYLAHPGSIEHRNEDKKQLENRRLLALYLQAAKQGRMVGFRPLQRLASLGVGAMASGCASSEIAGVVGLVDKLLNQGRSLPIEVGKRYLESRAVVVADGHISQQTLTGYAQAAEQALLASREWFARRCAVYGSMQREEAVVRHKVRSEAIRQANNLAQRNDVDAAVNLLITQGIRSAADDPAAYDALANLLLSANRYHDLLALVPEMPPATDPALVYELQAICHAALGDEARAETAAQQAITRGGNRARSLVVLGTLAARKGRQIEAERLFRQATVADPSCSSGWLSLGMLLWGQSQHESAWQAIQRAATVDPLNNEALTIVRDMAERMNRLTDVCRLFDQAIQLYPLSKQLAMQHAQVLSRTGQHAETLAACERFLVQFGVDDSLLALALKSREHVGTYDRLKQGGSASVSLCMIVKDEENSLACCLASVKPIVHEMIVVDTGSNDTTVAIATVFGAKVHHFNWNGNFSDARNFSLNQAAGSWVLVLDADEVVASQDYTKIQQAIISAAGQKVAWSVLTRNYTPKVHAQGWTSNDGSYPAEERAGGWHPSTKVRLFPAAIAIRFVGEIHEMVEPTLKTEGIQLKQADFVVHHYGELKDESAAIAKKQRYYALGKQKLRSNPTHVTALIELGVQAGELGLYQEAIEFWDRVLAIAPACVEALFNKGFALMGLKQYAEALELAREALKLEPLHKEAGFNYGTCALYVGNIAEALQRLSALMRHHSDYPPLLAIAVVLCLAVNRLSQAQQCHARLAAMHYAIEDYIVERTDVLRGQPNQELADVILKNWQQVKTQ